MKKEKLIPKINKKLMDIDDRHMFVTNIIININTSNVIEFTITKFKKNPNKYENYETISVKEYVKIKNG